MKLIVGIIKPTLRPGGLEELIRMRPGLTLESTATGLAGVARAATLQPDLVLIDIQLP